MSDDKIAYAIKVMNEKGIVDPATRSSSASAR